MNLEDLYHRAWQTPYNVNEHCPTLRLLASEADSVVEFGTNAAVSTTAILAGQPKRFMTVDLNPSPEAEKLRAVAGRTAFEILQADSLVIEIDSCDLLFIDSKHTAEQLAGELDRHAVKVRRWIVLHDTVTFGLTGEDGGRGLQAALATYLADHREWRIAAEWRNNNGLTVLKRFPP
jgi:predicted O-methyltransferase YrrM